jgi:predicted TIM-barrel fold metal-dependent hydrolase
LIQTTIDAVESLGLSPDEQNRIFTTNTHKLLRLDSK